MDRVAIRRKNLIKPKAFPYRNAVGMLYDSGRYEENMDWAMKIADWKGFNQRKREARKRGKLLGLGLCNYVESSIGSPKEQAQIHVRPEGRVDVVIGTQPAGQGHETSFAQVVSDLIQVPVEKVKIILGDTDVVKAGGGSHSGRSMKLAVPVIGEASDEIIAKGRRIAAVLMETSEADIEFETGRFRVAGTDREIGIFDVARAAATRADLLPELQGPLGAISDQTLPIASFPYGTQVCEVEVDPDTGQVKIVGYAAVDDVGRAINPLILHGQTHGGIAQGVGQALLEDCHYDPASGQLLTASFMDYAMPRADTFPPLATALSEVPSPSNRLGVRSGGEGGTTPALAAVVNAIVDALSEYGVRHVEMPATPERVWRAIRDARRAVTASV
jgi:aerobic carbon-monoxide dehydrogenase large subunit